MWPVQRRNRIVDVSLNGHLHLVATLLGSAGLECHTIPHLQTKRLTAVTSSCRVSKSKGWKGSWAQSPPPCSLTRYSAKSGHCDLPESPSRGSISATSVLWGIPAVVSHGWRLQQPCETVSRYFCLKKCRAATSHLFFPPVTWASGGQGLCTKPANPQALC